MQHCPALKDICIQLCAKDEQDLLVHPESIEDQASFVETMEAMAILLRKTLSRTFWQMKRQIKLWPLSGRC